MYILFLQRRLNYLLRRMIQTGDWSERGIARVAGISQPHVHNVLKGAREFSPEVSDRIMNRLGISLDDLLEGQSEHPLPAFAEAFPRIALVPILEGRLGPGHPFPSRASGSHRQLPKEEIEPLVQPVVLKLAPDPECAETVTESDWALVDLATPADCVSAWMFAVQTGCEGRLMRAERLATWRKCRRAILVRGVCVTLVKARPVTVTETSADRLLERFAPRS